MIDPQKANLFVLIVLVIAFFLVSVIMISKNGALQARIHELGERVRGLEGKVEALSLELKKGSQEK